MTVTDYTPHPDDVTLAVKATNIEFGIHEPTQQQEHYIEVVLAAVGPAHDKRVRAEVLTELVEEVNAKRVELQARARPEYDEAVSCLASTERWLKRHQLAARADAEEANDE